NTGLLFDILRINSLNIYNLLIYKYLNLTMVVSSTRILAKPLRKKFRCAGIPGPSPQGCGAVVELLRQKIGERPLVPIVEGGLRELRWHPRQCPQAHNRAGSRGYVFPSTFAPPAHHGRGWPQLSDSARRRCGTEPVAPDRLPAPGWGQA